MNLGDENSQLIDISTEDDFLIDSHLNDTFLDLRLSVALENQKELVSSSRSNYCTEVKERRSNLPQKEHRAFQPVKGSGEGSNARKSLAWDTAFFTSPGFLELEELCLVNSGFKNTEVSSSHEIEENSRRKICLDRCTNHKPGVGGRCIQESQSSEKTKVASPIKNTNSRKELSKSTVHEKKPPLRAISRYAQGAAVSKQPKLSTYDTNASIHFPSCTTSMDIVRTGRLLKSHTREGDAKEANSEDLHSLTHDINAFQAFNLESHHHYRNCVQQSLERCRVEKSTTKETKSSLNSFTNSSLRLPSQKIGFFDMKLDTGRQDQDGLNVSNKGQRRRNNQSSTNKLAQSLKLEEKENIFHPEDTVIEFQPMKSSPSPSKLVAVGSSTSSGHYSSSSEKCLTKTQRPKKQTMVSPTRSRIPYFTKVSPLKKSAFF